MSRLLIFNLYKLSPYTEGLRRAQRRCLVHHRVSISHGEPCVEQSYKIVCFLICFPTLYISNETNLPQLDTVGNFLLIRTCSLLDRSFTCYC